VFVHLILDCTFSFPLIGAPYDSPIICTLPERPSSVHKLSQLPPEFILQIASFLPLPSLLCFLSTSKQLRSTFIESSLDRNALARAWVETSAPWYLPLSDDHFPSGDKVTLIGWDYLRRCLDSGSMRNRRRIWGIAEQLERKADEIGV
jgi:hypothetical protein